MFCFKILFLALLVKGSTLSASEIDIHGQTILEHQYNNDREEVRVHSIETEPIGHPKDDNRFLFPRQTRENGSLRKDVSFAAAGNDFVTKSFRSLNSFLKNLSIQRNQLPSTDAETLLLECISEAVESSLTLAVSSQASAKTFFNRVVDIFGAKSTNEAAATAIDQDTEQSFVKLVTPCFELFKRDKNGNLKLTEDFETSEAAMTFKLRPNGPLTLAAIEAILKNVRLTYVRKRKPRYQFETDHEGLALALGEAIAKSTKVGQIAAKSTEGLGWFTKSVSQLIRGSEDQTTRGTPPRNQTPTVKSTEGSWLVRTITSQFNQGNGGQTNKGLATSLNQSPMNLIDLMECVLKVALSSLSIPALANQAFGAFKGQLVNNPAVGGLFGGIFKGGDSPASGQQTGKINANVLEVFIRDITPCFGFFRRDKDGQLVLDHGFMAGAAAEAIRQTPMGALALGSSEAIAKNVRAGERDKDGKIKYDIDRAGLATDLGKAVFDATKLGRLMRVGSLVTSFLRRDTT